jgi:hypothetical protein
MPPPPPFDRAIALACTMTTLRARYLSVRCGCGAIETRPVRQMLQVDPGAARRSLADVVVHIRCHACRQRPATIHLCADAHGPGPIRGGPEPGWSVLLLGCELDRSPL